MPFAAVKNNLFDYLAEGIPFYLITDIWVCQNLMHMCNLAHDIFLAWNLGRRLFSLPAESFGISHEFFPFSLQTELILLIFLQGVNFILVSFPDTPLLDF